MVFSVFNFLRSSLTLREVTDKTSRKERSSKSAFPSMPTRGGPRQPLPLEAPPGTELCFCPPASSPSTADPACLTLSASSPSAQPPPSTYLYSLSWPLSQGDTLCPAPEDGHRRLLNFGILTTAPEKRGSFLPTFSSETCFGFTLLLMTSSPLVLKHGGFRG